MKDRLFIERSIITTYRREIWRRFARAVKEYALVEEGDNIAVCMSGGKDSLLLAKCMQELQAHGDVAFGLKFLVMDPGYAAENRALIESNAAALGIPAHIFGSPIFDTVLSARECAAGICTARRSGSAATRSRSGITSTMSSRPS